MIDGSPPDEVLLGAPRLIRSDDWKAQLPLAFAQAAHRPAFPVVNTLVGLGQNALLPMELPVLHPLVLLRPTLWGFLLGDDTGMAWLWWSRVLGLAVAGYGVFRVVAVGRRGLAAAGAAILVASPFFQFWSFNAAPHVAAMGAAWLATVSLLRAARPAAIWASGAALAAAGAWFALAIYPPYQVTLAWLYVALVLGFWLDSRERLALRRHAVARTLALAAAGLVVLGVFALFVFEARPAIEAMRGTAYPGRRIATGGDRPLWQLLNASFGTGLWASRWGPLHNVCEAASFWLLAPMPMLLAAWRAVKSRARIDRLSLALLGYQAVLVAYAAVGFPEWLASATGLSFVPGRRSVIGIGLADALLLVRFLATAPAASRAERPLALTLALAWAGILALASVAVARALPDASPPLLLGFAVGNGALVGLALASRRRALAAWALAAASLATSVWFNPLVVGGSDYVRGNPLSQRIVEIDRGTPGGSTWVAFGRDDVANLFRAVGVRSVNGLLPLPQLALWRRIDPEARARSVYDRYAHFAFVATPGSPPGFRLHSQDYVIVSIDPASPALRTLGVTHALFRGSERERGVFERLAHLERIVSVGENHLYRVPAEGP